jgi:glycosyltransferase involved in cell wall biosynthesis
VISDRVLGFSIIVPTHNRPGALLRCLSALSDLSYPRNRFEVIIVDDGSAQPLEAVVHPFRDALDLSLVRQARAGPAAARNTGASQARGRFLAFADDDCQPAPDWLAALEVRSTGTPGSAICGRTLNALVDNPYSTAMQLIRDVVYAHYNANPDQAQFLASNNLAVPTKRFHSIGGFDAREFPAACSEDRDFCARWLHNGYPLIYAAEAFVNHAHPLNLRSYCEQHFRRGCWAFRYHQARSRRGSGRLRDDLGFYGDLLPALRGAFPAGPRGRALLLTILLALWQSVNAAGYVWERAAHSLGTRSRGKR